MRGTRVALGTTICVAFALLAGCGSFPESDRDHARIDVAEPLADCGIFPESDRDHIQIDVAEPLAGIETPLVAPLPVILGLHFPSGFERPITPGIFRLCLGPKVRASIELAARSRFQSVQVVEEWQPGSPGEQGGWDLLLMPRLKNFGFREDAGVGSVTISYAFSIYDPAGQLVLESEASGLDSVRSIKWGTWRKPVERLAARATRVALATWLIEFCEPDAIRQRIPSCILESLEVKSKGAIDVSPPKRVALVNWPNLRVAGADDTRGFIECLNGELAPTNLVSEEVTRNSVYPWLEPSARFAKTRYYWTLEPTTRFKETGQLIALLGREDVRRRLLPHARYIALVHSATEQAMGGPFMCGAGFGAAGCLGVQSGERKTQARAFVYDLLLEEARTLEATALGQKVMLGLILPMWHTSDTTGLVCRDVARQLRAVLDVEAK